MFSSSHLDDWMTRHFPTSEATTELICSVRWKSAPGAALLGCFAIDALRTIFNSNYNSLQAKVTKRFKGKTYIDANYTWSRGLTNAQVDYTGFIQNVSKINGDYGKLHRVRQFAFAEKLARHGEAISLARDTQVTFPHTPLLCTRRPRVDRSRGGKHPWG